MQEKKLINADGVCQIEIRATTVAQGIRGNYKAPVNTLSLPLSKPIPHFPPPTFTLRSKGNLGQASDTAVCGMTLDLCSVIANHKNTHSYTVLTTEHRGNGLALQS